MEIKGIKYISPAFDGSGYGQASRSYVLALHGAGIPVTLAPVSFEKTLPELGETGDILKSLLHKDIEYNIVIIHLTPEFWRKFIEVGKANIGYTVWETTKLHKDWPGYMNNSVDAILCPCEWNREVFLSSGVKRPIGIVPHTINVDRYADVVPYAVDGVSESAYKFYSVFQYTERKNPAALLKSFWAAFDEYDSKDVSLIIKTYKNSYSKVEKDEVSAAAKALRDLTPMNARPPVYLVLDLLSRNQLLGLHKFGDCFISLDRGEGFGLGGFEAGAVGNPIIVTGFGGALEYAKPDNSYLINHTLTPVWGMPWSPWYRGDQLWAEPDCGHAIETMRYVYEHRTEAKAKGEALNKFIKENFSEQAIVKKIVDNIKNLL